MSIQSYRKARTMKMAVFSVILLLAAFSAAFGSQLSFQGGNFVVEWTHLPATQEIEFNLTVKTTGWVALGVSKEKAGMKKLDLFAGGVNGGVGYLKDYYVDNTETPTEDAQKDATLVSSNEAGGYTKIRFKRKLNTGDSSKDNTIVAGEQLYLAWAYGSSDTLSYHNNNRGYSTLVTLVAVTPTTSAAVQPATTTVATSVAPSATAPPPSSVAPTTMPKTTTAMPSNDKELKFQNGNYLLNWKYDSAAKEITFTVTVNGVGWIGLGISETNKGMEKMDVAVAMVNSSGNGMVEDYYSIATAKPAKDTKQDFTFSKSSQQNGKTMVEFKRKLKTDDEKDVEIVVDKEYYVGWAYVKTSGQFDYHGNSNRGYSNKVVLAGSQTVNPTSTGAFSTISFAMLMSSVLVAILVS